MAQLLLQYHKHENALNISAFVHPLPAKKIVTGKGQRVLGLNFRTSHAFPHMESLKYNQNAPEKKKCCSFSRYFNWQYWAMFLV